MAQALACVAAFVALLLCNTPAQAHAGHAQADNPYPLDGLIRDLLHCGGDFLIQGTDLCTHGPDFEIPEGPQIAPPPITCDGDGVSGKRVQVLYVRELLSEDRYAMNLDLFRRVAADANRIVDDSAHETGGHRHIRFVTDAQCQIDVQHVVIPPVVDFTFSTLILSLKVLGYTDPDRKYLMFVDADVYCGIGTAIGDNRPELENRNNHQAGYARLDKGCWWGTAAAHELIHTLGGVQKDSPNTSGGWHCTDEWDIMCYSDAPNYPAMRFLCPHSHDMLLDCNHDDYFHTAPPPGSYLATHWNVADSAFLLVHNLPPMITLATEAGAATFERPAAITLIATAADPDGAVSQVEFFQGAVSLGVDDTAPYSITRMAQEAGTYTFTATALDDEAAEATSPPLVLSVVDPTPPPIVVRLSTIEETQVYTAPATIVFTADVSDHDRNIARVEFYRGATWLAEDFLPPYTYVQTIESAGVYTFTAQAVDEQGASGASIPVTITVNGPPTPPDVELSPPTVSAQFGPPDVITITAHISQANVEIERVDFYHKQTLLGSDWSAPYRFVWTGVRSGLYTFGAQVFDRRGRSAASSPTTIEVAASGPPPVDPPDDPGATISNPVYLPVIVRPDDEPQ
jgi:hypothetical protein